MLDGKCSEVSVVYQISSRPKWLDKPSQNAEVAFGWMEDYRVRPGDPTLDDLERFGWDKGMLKDSGDEW